MDLRTLIALSMTVFFWASAFVGIRVGIQSYSPGALALLRYLIASITLIPVYCLLKHRRKVRLRDSLQFLLAGLTGFTIYNVALNHGEITVPAGITSFIVGLIPIFTLLLAILFLKETINRMALIGVFISFLGVGLIAVGEHRGAHFDFGVLYNLIAALSGGIYAVSQKSLLKYYPPLQLVSIAIWIGTAILLVYAPALYHELPMASSSATKAAVFMGVFPGVIAYLAWGYALSRIPASRASMALYALPIVTTVMGYFYSGAVPAFYSLVGGLIALCGAIVAGRST